MDPARLLGAILQVPHSRRILGFLGFLGFLGLFGFLGVFGFFGCVFWGDQDITLGNFVSFVEFLRRAGRGRNPRVFTFPGASTHMNNSRVGGLLAAALLPGHFEIGFFRILVF